MAEKYLKYNVNLTSAPNVEYSAVGNKQTNKQTRWWTQRKNVPLEKKVHNLINKKTVRHTVV